MNPLLKKRLILFLFIFAALFLDFLFLFKQENSISIQLGLAYLIALGLPIAWIHVTFPIPFLHFWHFEKRNSFLGYVSLRWGSFIILCVAFLILLFSPISIKPALFWGSSLSFLLCGLFFYSIGQESLDWRTGKKGNKIRALAKETGSIMAPLGSFPSLIRTVLVTVLNVYLITFLFKQSDFYAHLFGFLFSLGTIGILIFRVKLSGILSDNAFFDEYFLIKESQETQKSIPIESLFWVPKSLKTDVRFILTQHVRFNSIGRIQLFAHVLFVLFVLAKPTWFSAEFGLLGLAFLLFVEAIQLTDSRIKMPSRSLTNHVLNLFKFQFLILIRWVLVFSFSIFITNISFIPAFLTLMIFIFLSTVFTSFLTFKKLTIQYG